MTLEGQEPGAEETPAPPARTRWSEETAEDDDVLLPPYVPGAPREPVAATPEPEAEPEPETAPEPAVEPEEPADYPWEPEGEAAEVVADEAWAEPSAEGFAGPAADAELVDLEPYEADYAAPETPAEEDVPYGAYDLGATGEEGLIDAAAEVEEEGAPELFTLPGLDAIPEETPAGEPEPPEAAERLEKLAAVLRREGSAGIQREAASRDRLTSLLAGVIAGYLAGLED